nr:ATP-binding protein [Vibrio cyclitrophicus]
MSNNNYMNSDMFSFRARARTIDHLGKGQIADTPTAVSELWKNSYDAYARNVALHTYDGDIKCGSIIDNGCGMSLKQLIDSWLVVGTESKAKKTPLKPEDMFGLTQRFTQGEKGIGRLSSAFLAPVTLLVTKKIHSDFTAVFIDWRLFENPYLSLEDVVVPMVQFSDLKDLSELCSKMQNDLVDNFNHQMDKYDDDPWFKFSEDEKNAFNNKNFSDEFISTKNKIINFSNQFEFDNCLSDEWEVQLNAVAKLDGDSHGTALFLLDLNRDLSLLTNSESKHTQDDVLLAIQDSVVDTLRSFINPYEKESVDFNYEFISFGRKKEETIILSHDDVFSYEDFLGLEHRIEGTIDSKGWFRGNVVAFGKDYGDVVLTPKVPLEDAKTKTGSFDIRIGTFEMDPSMKMTTHTESEFQKLVRKAERHSGFLIFRDNLRVLPYGRTDNDFFRIEERRGKNAGRYYWANRRLFAQIKLDQVENKSLKDKAGREGFIINEAARELKILVGDYLVQFADKYFGRNSDERKILLDIIRKERQERKDAQVKATVVSLDFFKKALKDNLPDLIKQNNLARNLLDLLKNTDFSTFKDIHRISDDIECIEKSRGALKTPVKPPKMNSKVQESYREYRDLYNELNESIKICRDLYNKLSLLNKKDSPYSIAEKSFNSKQSIISAQVSRYENLINSKINKMLVDWSRDSSVDRGRFHSEAISTLDSISSYDDLESSLNILDIISVNLTDDLTIKYEARLKTIEKLEQGVNLDSAFSMAEEEKSYFQDKANKLQAVAQLGLSVEVLSHELEQQDMLVRRGLNSLPSDIKKHQGFITAFHAHKSLTEQIRFLSPLKLAGYQRRQEITGVMIEEHVRKFYRDRFERQRVIIDFSEDFLSLSIRDLPSRIYPVFINILNNALYWVCLSERRHIKLDIINDNVVIGNSGPKVDVEYVPKLFEIFETERRDGHGVGLYLCQENLAVANHEIWYAEDSDEMLFNEGANFVIKFKGMERI